MTVLLKGLIESAKDCVAALDALTQFRDYFQSADSFDVGLNRIYAYPEGATHKDQKLVDDLTSAAKSFMKAYGDIKESEADSTSQIK